MKLKHLWKSSISLLFLGLSVCCLNSCSDDGDPSNMAPTVATGTASYITRTQATISGSVKSNGSGITECGFYYSDMESDLQVENKAKKVTCSSKEGTISATLEGLKPATIYYFRIYALSGKSRVQGNIQQFQTASNSKPGLAAIVASNIGEYSFTVKCSITDDGGAAITSWGYDYWVKGSEDISTKRLTAFDSGTNNTFTYTIENLTPGTCYEIRAFAENSAGTGQSEILEVTTTPMAAPVVKTHAMEAVHFGASWAKVSATITDAGAGAVTERGFCWSTTNKEPTKEKDKSLKVESAGNSYTAEISDLKPNTTYYLRAYAVNQPDGQPCIGYGNVVTFTTTSFSAPTLSAITISELAVNSVVAAAEVTSTGNGLITEKGFCWSKTNREPALDNSKKLEVEDEGTEFSARIEELEGGTHYYIRDYVKSKDESKEHTIYSAVSDFNTKDYTQPTLSNLQAKNATQTTVNLSVEMTNGDVTITEKGFCWGTTEKPTVNGNKQAVEGYEFETMLNDLLPGTRYYVRAYVTYQLGSTQKTLYSDDGISFTTDALNVPSSLSTEEVSQTTAKLKAVLASNDVTVTEKGFCWGTSEHPTTGNQKQVITGDVLEYTVTGLAPGTTYYFRAYIIYAAGKGNQVFTVYSEDAYFTTLQLSPSTLSKVVEKTKDFTSVTVSSSITKSGDGTVTERGFLWSEDYYRYSEDITLENCDASYALDANAEFTYTIPDLKQNTYYTVRAYVKEELGGSKITTYSECEFVQVAYIESPYIYQPEANDVGATSFTVSSHASNGNPTIKEVGFCWTTDANQNPADIEDANRKKVERGSDGNFSLKLTDLKEKTTYYVYAYAINELGIVYYSSKLTQSVKYNPSEGDIDLPGII